MLFMKTVTSTKGNPKVRSPYGKMTPQAKNFVVVMKLIIIIVNTNNIMFNSFLVSSLGCFEDGYPTQNMENDTVNDTVIWFSALVYAT